MSILVYMQDYNSVCKTKYEFCPRRLLIHMRTDTDSHKTRSHTHRHKRAQTRTRVRTVTLISCKTIRFIINIESLQRFKE